MFKLEDYSELIYEDTYDAGNHEYLKCDDRTLSTVYIKYSILHCKSTREVNRAGDVALLISSKHTSYFEGKIIEINNTYYIISCTEDVFSEYYYYLRVFPI